MTTAHHLGHDLDALCERDGLQTEPVHTQVGPRIDESLEVFKVLRVAAMANDHAGEVYALFREDSLLIQPAAQTGVSMGRDRHASLTMSLGDGAKRPLNIASQSGLVGHALENPCAHRGIADSCFDVRDK